MQYLAGFLGSFFTMIFAFVAKYLGKKFAFGSAIAATLLALSTAFYLSMVALLNGFVHTFNDASSHWFLVGFYAILPANFTTCITIIFTAEIAAYMYRYKLFVVQAVSSSN